MKQPIIAFIPTVIGVLISYFVIFYLSYLNISRSLVLIIGFIPTLAGLFAGFSMLFVSQYWEQQIQKNERIKVHYNKLYDEIISKWKNFQYKEPTPTPPFDKWYDELYSNSNIINDIKSAARYRQLVQHIQTGYREFNDIFNEMTKKEQRYKETVLRSKDEIKNNIRNAIHRKNNHTGTSGNGSFVPRCTVFSSGQHDYSKTAETVSLSEFADDKHIEAIVDHFWKESINIHADLMVDTDPIKESYLYLHRADDPETQIVNGKDQKKIESLKKIIDDLRPTITAQFQNLMKETHERSEWLNEFKLNMASICVDLEDGYFNGKCDFEDHLSHKF